MRLFNVLAVALALFLIPMACDAAVISGLNATGLAGIGNTDTNYASDAAVTTFPYVGITADPNWVVPTEVGANWIWDGSSSEGTLDFYLKITVSGLGAADFYTVTGDWATDNSGVMTLGANVIATRDFDQFGATSSFSFDLTSNGDHVVKFSVTNIAHPTQPNPGGLLVENLSAEVYQSEIPEPMSVLVWGFLGLVGVIGLRRYRKIAG